MKKIKIISLLQKLFIMAAVYGLFILPLSPVFPVHGAPISMTLVYDGKNHDYNAESIELRVNGAVIDLTIMPPVILDSRTYVPSREVFEPLGALVEWKPATKELYIAYESDLIVIKPDETLADVNGQNVEMEAPAKIINDKLMIPVRFVAESLGIPVDWDSAGRIVSIGVVPEQIIVVNPQQPPAQEQPTVQEPSPVQTPAAPVQGGPSNSAGSMDVSPGPIPEAAGSTVNITKVSASGRTYVVDASGPISKVEKSLLEENKIVLDIYNAANTLTGPYTYSGYAGVTSVRNSQFQIEPIRVTRIVFDLSGPNKYTVSLSEDRKQILVEFQANAINNVSFEANTFNDRIIITGETAVNVKGSRMFSPDRLVFDLPGAKNSLTFAEQDVNGQFAGKIRASQFDDSTVRIVVDLKDNADYIVENSGNSAIITLSAPTYKNIRYTQSPGTITLVGGISINPALITHTDNYLNKQYKLTLPGNYSELFGHGTIEINDGVINSIAIQNNDLGNTEIVINEAAIYAFVISEQGQDLAIRAAEPKSVYKSIVFVDPGHGGNDPGAQYGGFQEKNLNLNIVQKLYQLLENDNDIKVYASRLDDSRPDNASRAKTANQIADLFVSVHHNSIANNTTSGTEVLYLNHEGEVYPAISSEAVARIFQTNLINALGTKDRGVIRRPDLIVLNSTTIPAVLVEVSFLTNSSDLSKVSTEEGRQIVAESLYKSIKEVFAQYPTGR